MEWLRTQIFCLGTFPNLEASLSAAVIQFNEAAAHKICQNKQEEKNYSGYTLCRYHNNTHDIGITQKI